MATSSPTLAAASATLCMAAGVGDADWARRLLAEGASPEAVLEEGSLKGHTPMMLAVAYIRKDLVELLFPLSDLSRPFPDGRSLLMVAAGNRCPEIARLLLPHFDAEIAFRGATPLMVAAKSNYPEVAEVLLTKANPDARGLGGRTALHFAAESDSYEAIEVLLSRCDPNARDDNGDTPLARALLTGSLDAALGLAPHTALRAENQAGESALTLARSSKYFDQHESDKIAALMNELLIQQDAESERAELATIAQPAPRSAKRPRV